jgi:hypothetical protein
MSNDAGFTCQTGPNSLIILLTIYSRGRKPRLAWPSVMNRVDDDSWGEEANGVPRAVRYRHLKPELRFRPGRPIKKSRHKGTDIPGTHRRRNKRTGL